MTSNSDAARLLGTRIREERQRFAINQMELAELAGLHFTNLGKIERGQAKAKHYAGNHDEVSRHLRPHLAEG